MGEKRKECGDNDEEVNVEKRRKEQGKRGYLYTTSILLAPPLSRSIIIP